jgi:hypothetical protein
VPFHEIQEAFDLGHIIIHKGVEKTMVLWNFMDIVICKHPIVDNLTLSCVMCLLYEIKRWETSAHIFVKN